jgi:hypothetical protein
VLFSQIIKYSLLPHSFSYLSAIVTFGQRLSPAPEPSKAVKSLSSTLNL